MKKLIWILMMLIPCTALGATYIGTYVDGSNIYSAPAISRVYLDGSPWTSGNLAFSNASTAANGNLPGKVNVTLSNVTTAGDYLINAKDSAGTWHRLEVRHEYDSFTNISSSLDGISNKTDKLPNYW